MEKHYQLFIYKCLCVVLDVCWRVRENSNPNRTALHSLWYFFSKGLYNLPHLECRSSSPYFSTTKMIINNKIMHFSLAIYFSDMYLMKYSMKYSYTSH